MWCVYDLGKICNGNKGISRFVNVFTDGGFHHQG